ncbi:acyl carrier protein [Clostridium sp. MSJ-4]|uniref:Acyl carrier protein n=1 Tax=Clostridium simiarum TaxID=2841506 RepID=A0ABS6EXK2_9CLOT|nr:acyl carrier protein [Clostridium simiarum]MBU5590956.1 acyl carrier protein [Clostridium simiarum]
MILDKVKKIIGTQLDIEGDKLQLSTTFEELGVDSLDLFQIVIELEEEFNIQIAEVENIKTIEDVVEYIESVTK